MQRKLWQGSYHHRGMPESPGRVAPLFDTPLAVCTRKAYLVEAAVVQQTFDALDQSEKNGYDKRKVILRLRDERTVAGIICIGEPGNFAWLGDGRRRRATIRAAQAEMIEASSPHSASPTSIMI